MSEEQTVAIVSFEGAVKREARRLKEALEKANLGGGFELHIRVSGPINEPSLKISYTLGDDTFSGVTVTGDSSQAVLDEFLRRKGWKANHDPKAITYRDPSSDPAPSADTSGDEEVPF
jgi:hypothetical protein